MRAAFALGIEAVFFALAFGVRCWVQWRRTGSTGLVLPAAGAPLPERAGAALFTGAIAAMVAAPLADLAGLGRWSQLDNPTVVAIGAALAIGGVASCVAAQFAMGDSWRIGVDTGTRTDLVMSGVFTLVRNPIFTAMVLTSVGLGLLIPNPLSAIAVIALVVGLELQVRCVEEPYLLRSHGDRYARYGTRVGRFVPGLGLIGDRP